MVIGQQRNVSASSEESKKAMTESSSVKSLVGGEVKVLNDMVGSVTVSAWREQADRAAVRLCGETGKMMLHGTFPSVRPDTYYDKQLLIDTLMDLFKRSSKKWSATWLDDDEGEHGTIKLAQTGYIERLLTTHSQTARLSLAMTARRPRLVAKTRVRAAAATAKAANVAKSPTK